MMHRVAMALHIGALVLVMGSMLLPDGWRYLLSLAALLLLWIPVGRLLGRGSGFAVKLILLLGVCLLLSASPQLQMLMSTAGRHGGIAVSLPLAWLCCVLAVPESVVFVFPLALLSVFNAGTLSSPATPVVDALIGPAAVLILISGCLFFISALKHPAQGMSAMVRPNIWRFSPHLVISLFAIAIMLLTVEWFRGRIGKLGQLMPEGRSDEGMYSLEQPPPKFHDRTVCHVYSLAGPLPYYLAETVYYRYLAGAWVDGHPSTERRAYYGQAPAGRAFTAQGRCLIELTAPKAKSLAPAGAFISGQSYDNAPVSSRSDAALFSWDLRDMTRAEPELLELSLALPDLKLLPAHARALCRDAGSDEVRVARIVNYLRQHNLYDMSREFRSHGSSLDPIEDFVLRGGSGWCVHFASAAAIMLRANGIPARFITGYVVIDEKSADSGQAEVLDRYGHAWCEALIAADGGRRWVIIDPSAAPAPAGAVSGVQLRYLAAGALLLSALLLIAAVRLHSPTEALRRQAAGDETGDDRQRVLAAYRRMVAAFEQMGVMRRAAWTPLEFALYGVPANCRADAAIITDAYIKVRYMGYRELGQSMAKVMTSQTRLLKMAGRR